MEPFILIDTHAHPYLQEFDADLDAVLQRAHAAGVKKIYLPNIDTDTLIPLQALVATYPGICFPMTGLHPCSVDADYVASLSAIRSAVEQHPCVAIGEIGTDMYWDKTYAYEQEVCFREQLVIAKARKLPVVIHSRETLDWNIRIVRETWGESLRGVFHCFTGSVEQARQIIEMGFFLGIGGVLTFRNSGLAEVVAQLPLASLVLETDAPYLSPHPHRGKRNEPGFLGLIAQKLADCMDITVKEVAQSTTANAARLFGSENTG